MKLDVIQFHAAGSKISISRNLDKYYSYFQWTEDGQGFQIQYLTRKLRGAPQDRVLGTRPGQASRVKYWIWKSCLYSVHISVHVYFDDCGKSFIQIQIWKRISLEFQERESGRTALRQDHSYSSTSM